MNNCCGLRKRIKTLTYMECFLFLAVVIFQSVIMFVWKLIFHYVSVQILFFENASIMQFYCYFFARMMIGKYVFKVLR
ncbi:hypothetical protein DX928_02780 [Bacillus swezeyi]|nr:hypothetical protein DX928_02780 [Bacillus swezeyi]